MHTRHNFHTKLGKKRKQTCSHISDKSWHKTPVAYTINILLQ